ncbi:MAG: ATP-dependent DNA helicase RecG [Bacteroidetes bacterium]|nr:ATP-dependent DNA helicase RecG [Bacteroidota bacterium]
MATDHSILSSSIEFLKGVGPLRADLLKKELNLFTFFDMLQHYPYRHIDRTRLHAIRQLDPATEFAQVSGQVISFEVVGQKSGRRLVAQLRDNTGQLELTWFQGLNWVQKMLHVGRPCLVYGRISFFNGRPQMVHPELEWIDPNQPVIRNFLEPIYSTTEKLKAKGLGGKAIGKLTRQLFAQIREKDLPENLPASILQQQELITRWSAFQQIHFPTDASHFEAAVHRIKFEELFLAQLRMNLLRIQRHQHSKGVVFDRVGDAFNTFYNQHLPFELTGAQKRVIKEIRTDLGSGRQMNRLLQGDVGSGKTMVAVLIMLLAIDNGYQSCLMAPTEILSRQHYDTIQPLLEKVGVRVGLLTGSTKAAARKKILAELLSGELSILIGTHALIEEAVQFQRLGLAIIDEQHRFGVAQRAQLQKKAAIPPHVLVMTATPIPRTLAMTAYGDLDYSVIDEMPPGRKPVKTVHRYENRRIQVMEFVRCEIDKGRQVYIIFPLIEESAKLDYENLMKGYEQVKSWLPEPRYWISMVHGKQPADVKETNMRRFVEGDTQIMVSTTVIEVGVNVPNASVMVIESSEKFGLSQLHQLRGRVGRGAEQSYCILMTGSALGADARERLAIMTATNNGFEIAEKDLALRGPGDIEGTRQSGALNLKLASLIQDRDLLLLAQSAAQQLAEQDSELTAPENQSLRQYLQQRVGPIRWSRIA